MKWPFDPNLLMAVEAEFIIFMTFYAVMKLWLAWTLLVVGVMRDLFG
jgi:hypothetical protein